MVKAATDTTNAMKIARKIGDKKAAAFWNAVTERLTEM